ncbi:lipocalin-like domain-containing protein [uncultured Bacteroides sp.]|uniref:lipocalin-like domain-containing protein n=1 Tax=uncultured Bacteroides sp. TaxID=162156 RepID=UPI002594B719|nr:lipocalin-like domain-containing protein [uncultured Bacteroides sp.]
MKQLSLKKLIKFKYVLLFLCLQLISCEKAPIRSDVEGFWRLERYTVLSTDETVECNRLYYSITRLVTEVSDKGGNGFEAYIARTGYEDNENTLVLSDFKVRGGTADNGEDAPVEKLRNYGINSREETKFRIIDCDGKTMTLESDYARLELRKF